MFVDTTLNIRVPLVNAGTAKYAQMPYRGRVINVIGIVHGTTSDTSVNVTLTAPSQSSGVTLGVLNFNNASGVGAGEAGTYTANASTGNTVLSADTPLLFTVLSTSIGAVSTACQLQVELSPY